MTKTNKLFVIFLFVTIIVASSAFFLPELEVQGLTGTVIVTIISTATLIGAVWFFLSSLKSFKQGLKVAYYWLGAGIIFYSFILLQLFLVIFAGIEDVVLRNMLFLVPYGLASFFAYVGMRKFTQLLDIKTIWGSFFAVLTTAVVLGLVATWLPPPSELIAAGIDEMTFDLIVGVLTWSVIFGLSAAVLALYVRRTISSTYKAAVTWTASAQFFLAFSALHELITKIYFFQSDYVASDFSLWPFVLTGVLFLRAGLAFKETELKALQLPETASYMEVVAAMAQLVSKPAAVSNELHILEAIEARTTDPAKLSSEDKTALKQAYLYLEDYLVSREPLSKFSREMLRENLPQSFVSSLGKQVGSDFFHDRSAKPL